MGAEAAKQYPATDGTIAVSLHATTPKDAVSMHSLSSLAPFSSMQVQRVVQTPQQQTSTDTAAQTGPAPALQPLTVQEFIWGSWDADIDAADEGVETSEDNETEEIAEPPWTSLSRAAEKQQQAARSGALPPPGTASVPEREWAGALPWQRRDSSSSNLGLWVTQEQEHSFLLTRQQSGSGSGGALSKQSSLSRQASQASAQLAPLSRQTSAAAAAAAAGPHERQLPPSLLRPGSGALSGSGAWFGPGAGQGRQDSNASLDAEIRQLSAIPEQAAPAAPMPAATTPPAAAAGAGNRRAMLLRAASNVSAEASPQDGAAAASAPVAAGMPTAAASGLLERGLSALGAESSFVVPPSRRETRNSMAGSVTSSMAAVQQTRQEIRASHMGGLTAKPVPWDGLWSEEGAARQYPALRTIVSGLTGKRDVIPLHGGLPPAQAFPFESITLRLRDGTTIDLADPGKVAAAQQYCTSPAGHPALVDWAMQHVEKVHSPPGPHQVTITNGSNHAIELIMALLLEPGDYLLCEEYTYPHLVDGLIALKQLRPLPLALDENGIVPASLRQVLEGKDDIDWALSDRPPPKVLYTIPTGQNPTGCTASLERKQEIYNLCRQHDVIILEDDPYFYLQFGSPGGEVPGLKGLVPSYLSLDVDGRVVRLDSFSKVLAPGLRLGWITAAPTLMDKFVCALQASTLGACSMSQVLVAELLQAWGLSGLHRHVRGVQMEYKRRAAVIAKAAESYLGDLATFQAPTAGMFLWLRLTAAPDADAACCLLAQHNVGVVPGRIARCCRSVMLDRPSRLALGGPLEVGPGAVGAGPAAILDPCPFLRVSFAAASDEQLRTGMLRLGNVLRGLARADGSSNSCGGAL